MGALIDLIGKQFGRWLVLKRIENNKHGARWLCKCECGNTRGISGASLRYERSQSCGCLQLERTIKANRKPEGVASFNRLYTAYLFRAKRRGLEFNLTKEQFKKLTSKKCYYCGANPSTVSSKECSLGDYIFNGIDRVDSSVGYNIKNCVPCCKICNYAKKDMSEDDFLIWVKRIYEYQSKIGVIKDADG